jgi:predicted DCC family thiol-disulfide oxidoreductase YuxK
MNPTTAATQSQPRARVLYDGDCALCQKSIAGLRKLDWLGKLDYVNARGNVPPHDPPLEQARLMEEMHLLPPNDNRVFHGFGAFRYMAWRLPLLWPVAPFLYIPGVPSLGQWIYLWVARNRLKLVPCHNGVCTIPPRTK